MTRQSGQDDICCASALRRFLAPATEVAWGRDGVAEAAIQRLTPQMEANASFFGHRKWGDRYFRYENFSASFGARWRAATGSWNGKVVVDLGCGPGNLYRAVGGAPAALIGVDISRPALRHARRIGYLPLLADAHRTPLRSGFADIVAANATLHHCDDMAAALVEAARLVRPGGLLVTDEDPLLGVARYRGLGRLAIRLRSFIPLVRVRGHAKRSWRYVSLRERRARMATEVHRAEDRGEGIAARTFREVLEPRGFEVRLLPHHHVVGAGLLTGDRGFSSARARLTQRLSGLDPDATDLDLSVMCIAVRRTGPRS